MKKLGLKNQKYVCFCVRDETYYRDFKPDLYFGSAENFEFRNAKSENYQNAAEFLREKGVLPVLMGFSSASASDTFIRPALSPEFRPWVEAYLFRECLFTVGMMTGTTLYASLFGRPVLWSDIFWRGAPVGGRQDLILPKKIIQRSHPNSKNMKDSWVELQMKQWVQLGPPPDNDWAHFSKKGYESKACSPEEILDAVKDMVILQNTKKLFQSLEERAIHKEFSALHLRETKKLGHPPTRLAPSWARNNLKLIKSRNMIYEKYWLCGEDKFNLELTKVSDQRQTKRVLIPKNSR